MAGSTSASATDKTADKVGDYEILVGTTRAALIKNVYVFFVAHQRDNLSPLDVGPMSAWP